MNMHFGFNTKFSALRAEIYIYEHLYMNMVTYIAALVKSFRVIFSYKLYIGIYNHHTIF